MKTTETETITEIAVSYEKPTISTYTESELLEAMEAWGASTTVGGGGYAPS